MLVSAKVLPPSFVLSVGPVAPWATVVLATVVAQLAAFAATRRELRIAGMFTAITVVNTLSMATAGRRLEFALLRLAWRAVGPGAAGCWPG
ncbi:hypothetical protein [Streptomyces africanus]|nr:hypothetical protein [Streptomyces africanus]